MAGESQKTKQMKERKSLKAFLNNICILDTFQIFESQAYGAGEMVQGLIKSSGRSYRRPGFDSQHPYGGSQPPMIPEGSILSSGLCGHQAHLGYIDTHACMTPTHTK